MAAFCPAQPDFGKRHRLDLAHRVGNQPLVVQAVHRVLIERPLGPRAHHRIAFMDAEIEQSHYRFVDPVLFHGSRVSHRRLA